MPSAKRIILVQNDPYLIETRKALLEQHGYVVENVHSLEEARTVCRQLACDLVIVDSEEDYRSATDLCQEIKAENPDMAVAVLTWDAAEVESDCPDEVIKRRNGPRELLDKVKLALG